MTTRRGRQGLTAPFSRMGEAAPQRTASRKASSLSGGSKPAGSGSATFSITLAPRLDLPNDLQFFAQVVVLDRGQGEQVLRAVEGRLQGRGREGARRTSLTIHCRERTLISWPCSGGEGATLLIVRALGGAIRRCGPWQTSLEGRRIPRFSLRYTDGGDVSSTVGGLQRPPRPCTGQVATVSLDAAGKEEPSAAPGAGRRTPGVGRVEGALTRPPPAAGSA
jgi:hypothetical protein